MGKSYDCVINGGCISNKNGWCTTQKRNGLAGTTGCVDAKYKSAEKSTDDLELVYRAMGKREMLYIIQRQFVASKGLITGEILASLSAMLDIEEQINEVDKHSNSIIDDDIRTASRKMV